MFFTIKNLIRHVVILLMSLVLLIPCVWLLNTSYYTSISKVNYWEEKEVVGLLTFILNNTDSNIVKQKLSSSIDTIRYLAIRIERGPEIIVDKKIEGALIDNTSIKTYDINNYKVITSRRMYPGYLSDYKKYLYCYLNTNIYFSSDINKLLNDSKSLLYHRNLIFLVAHLSLIFIIEIVVLSISIKYRLNQLICDMK